MVASRFSRTRTSALYTTRHYTIGVINPTSNLNGNQYFLFQPLVSLLVRAGIFYSRSGRDGFCNGSRSVNEDRCCEMRKKILARCRYVKLECPPRTGLVDHADDDLEIQHGAVCSFAL